MNNGIDNTDMNFEDHTTLTIEQQEQLFLEAFMKNPVTHSDVRTDAYRIFQGIDPTKITAGTPSDILTMVSELVIEKLSKGAIQEVAGLPRDEASILVRQFYVVQRVRLSSENQARKFAEDGKNNSIPLMLTKNMQLIEDMLADILKVYIKHDDIGKWLIKIPGIKHIIAAGLLAMIDFKRIDNANQILRYAGIDPTVKWEKGKKIPWNPKLKNLTYLIGRSFDFGWLKYVAKSNRISDEKFSQILLEKSGDERAMDREMLSKGMTQEDVLAYSLANGSGSNIDDDSWNYIQKPPPYGAILEARFQYEFYKNQAYEYKDQAENQLTFIKKNSKTYPWIIQGKLSPTHLRQRARRYTCKIFYNHLFEVAYFYLHGVKPTMPIAIMQYGHKDYIPVPFSETIKGYNEAPRVKVNKKYIDRVETGVLHELQEADYMKDFSTVSAEDYNALIQLIQTRDASLLKLWQEGRPKYSETNPKLAKEKKVKEVSEDE